MELSFQIDNEEDIQYLKSVENSKINDLLKTAVTIGLKSIQLSEVTMDCNSYIDPIKDIVHQSMESNRLKIEDIDEKLDSILYIRANSTKKGRLSENICYIALSQQYPTWEFNDMTQIGHQGDCHAINTPIGDILYEFKNYSYNVNKEQIRKFHLDLENTGIKFGVFVSNTSGIVGKKNLEWEIIKNDTIVVYISNSGINGFGSILGTEFLLAMNQYKIIDNDWNIVINSDKLELHNNLQVLFEQYKINISLMNKFKKSLSEYRDKMNHSISELEKDIYMISNDCDMIFDKMLIITKNTENNTIIIDKLEIDEYIKQYSIHKNIANMLKELENLLVCKNNYEFKYSQKEIIIYNSKVKGKIIILKDKLKIQIFDYSLPIINFDPILESCKDKIITIEMNSKNIPSIITILKLRFLLNE